MRKLFYISILAFIVTALAGQTDSTSTVETSLDSLNVKYDRIYKLFLEQNNQETRHLFKFNIIGLSQLAPLLCYEQKIGKSFSLVTSLGLGSTSKLEASSTLYGYSNKSMFGYYASGYEMIRYYYNINRRERLGKNTNGFSGNFFALQVAGVYIHDNVFIPREVDHEVFYEADISYGIQRRIGNIGFIEPSASLFLRPENGSMVARFSINLEMGFAIDSFSNLDRMLKK